MQKIDGHSVHLIIPNELLSEIDRIAERQGLTRSDIMRRFLDVGVEFFTDFEKIGVVKVSEVFERIKATFHENKNIGQKRLF